nr:zinc ribbon domain-containing protein [Micromonospora sp. DSM 115978]
MHRPIATRPATNHYFLRGLLRCRPCGGLLVPAFSSCGRRLYGCPRPGCPRPWIPAGETEDRVWTRFRLLNEDAARDVPPARRQEALVAVLNEIVVGVPSNDLEYDWRD